jgi:aminoglycoside 6'-N-acetyltransferase
MTNMMRLRPATLADVPTLQRWDKDPDVISCTTDDPEADTAFDHIDWPAEIAARSDVSFHLIAEVEGRPVGALQIIDPHLEPTHYWGDVAENLRAVDIWIGAPEDRGRGYGTEMMRLALAQCFAAPEVTAILIDPLASNTDAQRFYERLGFEFDERRLFNGEDDCFVMRLERRKWRGGL